MLLKVKGKGGKHRLVPISFEGRQILFRWVQKHQFPVVFSTRSGTRMTRRNISRDITLLCQRAGITGVRTSPRTCTPSP